MIDKLEHLKQELLKLSYFTNGAYHQAKTDDDKALEMINNTISHLAKSLKNIIDEAKI